MSFSESPNSKVAKKKGKKKKKKGTRNNSIVGESTQYVDSNPSHNIAGATPVSIDFNPMQFHQLQDSDKDDDDFDYTGARIIQNEKK